MFTLGNIKKHFMCVSTSNVTLALVMKYSLTNTLETADRVMQLRAVTVANCPFQCVLPYESVLILKKVCFSTSPILLLHDTTTYLMGIQINIHKEG